MKRSGVVVVGSLAVVLGAGRVAHATDIFLEAEAARLGIGGRITTPMLIKDDLQASHGSYIEVIPGNDSKDSMPSTEGVVSLSFNQPDASASFTIWARVIAANDGDDSFWVKMDNGSAIKWNGIPIGSSWHWVQVKADGSSTPSHFTLGTGLHTLKIAYREDGTKLDELIITSNSSFDPNAVTVPATPQVDDDAEESSNAGGSISWQDVPGATSYTLTDDLGHVISTGLTSHMVVGPEGCFEVIAVGTGGSSAPSDRVCIQQAGFILRKFPDTDMSIVSPMKLVGSALGTQSGTAESLNTVPAHGRGRMDFRIVGPITIQVFAEVGAPNKDNDSFWVRMDQGSWVKWNNIADGACSVVQNSDAGGATMNYTLQTGSHFIEIAYREIGTVMFRLVPTEADPEFSPCED
jgi:hypothetical protein